MPGMNGKELNEWVKRKYPELKHCLYRGTCRHRCSAWCMEEGTNFLQKPFTLETLLKKIQRYSISSNAFEEVKDFDVLLGKELFRRIMLYDLSLVPSETRTRTPFAGHRILSPVRLPIPPSRQSSFFEAPSGFEPLHKSFADFSLTTWVRRHRIILSTSKRLFFDYTDNKSPATFSVTAAGLFVERETGLEPATSTLARLRSTN